MKSQVFKSNKTYWSKENYREKPDGILLYENYYNNSPQLCYGISKVALCIAKSLNLTPAVLLPWYKSQVSESMCQMQFQIKRKLTLIIIRHIFKLIYTFLTVNKESLLSLKIKKDSIGPYMYDSVIRKFNKKTIDKLSIKERAYICFELCHYFYFNYIVQNYPIKSVVLGDNVYRYGYLYEICRNNDITCYSPVNLNTVFIRKFKEREDYKSNFLTHEKLNLLCEKEDYLDVIKKYLSNRYSGNILQHDVLSAYANKKVTSSSEFNKKYSLDLNKKTVVIMSHVFADAPHVYTGALYDDYWIWFEQTFNCLIKNKDINLLVKEHPSAHLYGEKGLVYGFLKDKNFENLKVDDNESTLSILQNVDAVVTCGGTIGIEIACFGKNVILASKSYYANLGFTVDFDNRIDYENYLMSNIQHAEPLSDTQKELALKAAYVLFCRVNNWNSDLELGGDIIYMGREYDNNSLYSNMIEYNKKPLVNQNIYNLLDRFVHSEMKEFYSEY